MSQYKLVQLGNAWSMMSRHPEGCGWATPIFKYLNYLEISRMKTVEYFCIILFALSYRY